MGFRVDGMGLRVWSLFVSGPRRKVNLSSESGHPARSCIPRVLGFGIYGLGATLARHCSPVSATLPINHPGFGFTFRAQGSGFRVQGSGFRVQGSGFRVQGVRVGVRG